MILHQKMKTHKQKNRKKKPNHNAIKAHFYVFLTQKFHRQPIPRQKERKKRWKISFNDDKNLIHHTAMTQQNNILVRISFNGRHIYNVLFYLRLMAFCSVWITKNNKLNRHHGRTMLCFVYFVFWFGLVWKWNIVCYFYWQHHCCCRQWSNNFFFFSECHCRSSDRYLLFRIENESFHSQKEN